jgi:hypothetical protein
VELALGAPLIGVKAYPARGRARSKPSRAAKPSVKRNRHEVKRGLTIAATIKRFYVTSSTTAKPAPLRSSLSSWRTKLRRRVNPDRAYIYKNSIPLLSQACVRFCGSALDAVEHDAQSDVRST